MSEAEIQPQATVREASIADAAAIHEAYNAYVGNGFITFDLDGKSLEHFQERLTDPGTGHAYLVAVDAYGEVLGYGHLFPYSDRCGYKTTGETSVYLRPGNQRRGVGTLIKHALIERARELGYHHLVAKLVADNTASLEYNKRMGYEIVGTQREVGWVNGRWHDVVIMQLLLD